jgi:hypothetical protein
MIARVSTLVSAYTQRKFHVNEEPIDYVGKIAHPTCIPSQNNFLPVQQETEALVRILVKPSGSHSLANEGWIKTYRYPNRDAACSSDNKQAAQPL